MTKADEIARIREIAQQFGQDSYLGPMLTEFSALIERDIKCDIIPDLAGMTKQLADDKVRLTLEKEDLETIVSSLKMEIFTLEQDKKRLQGTMETTKESARHLIYNLQRLAA